MSEIAMNTARLLDMLPQEDKLLAYELIKRIFKAWDPDFTKLTPEEAKMLEEAEKGEFVSENEIDWNAIGKEENV